MDIKGLDYNTKRERLLMPEYGREIQKMVDHAVSLPTKEERQKCACTIIQLMETKVPQLVDSSDYEQTLWDHLYLMSHKQLDIDWPYDVSHSRCSCPRTKYTCAITASSYASSLRNSSRCLPEKSVMH